jgi:hypothetical protein
MQPARIRRPGREHGAAIGVAVSLRRGPRAPPLAQGARSVRCRSAPARVVVDASPTFALLAALPSSLRRLTGSAVTLVAMRHARERWSAWSAAAGLRWGGCLSVGLIAVHQLRLLAAPSSAGHASVVALLMPAGVLMAAAALALVGELVGIRRGRAPAPGCASPQRVWVVATLVLIALFVAQELLEGLLLHGHEAGLAGVFGLGGWTALPLAVAVGGIVALIMVGVRSALSRAAGAPRRRERPRAVPRRRLAASWRPAGVLARKLASRAPPAPAA